MKSSYERAVEKPVRYVDDSDMLVKCTNQNFVEENTISYFRTCTRCSSYFCYQCCGLSQKILKLLNDRNDNYSFCPDCAKPVLNALSMDKGIEEKYKSCFSLLQPRIVDLEKHSISLKIQINNKVDNSVFDDMINESKNKLETFESNLSCLRSEIDNLQPHPATRRRSDVVTTSLCKSQ